MKQKYLFSASVACSLAMGGIMAAEQPAASGRPFIAYSSASFFRTPLPDNAPVDPESDAGIRFVKNNPKQTGWPCPKLNGLEPNKWGMPYYMGEASDPTWRLTGNVPAEVDFLRTQGFHAPAELSRVLTGTSDSPMVIIDHAGGFTLWASRCAAGSEPLTITVGNAGAFFHNSNGLDKRNPRSDSTKNFRSRGAIPDAMVIRKDLIEYGIKNQTDLGHVLHMFWPGTQTAFVHPMVGAEPREGWGPEGIRIRIKASVNLASRPLSPAGLVIARTLQRYGAYLGDNSGNAATIKLEQDHGQWGNLITQDALKGITWDDFEFVKRGYQPGS